MKDCVFCRIVNRDQPSNIIYETESLIVIPDILPKAPVHFLVIPKEHIVSAHELGPSHEKLISEMILSANKLADEQGIGQTGYKMIFNVGKQGGQIISHLHLHVMGGKQLSE